MHALRNAVEEYGEVHAVIEDEDRELEIRRGQVEWETPSSGYFAIESNGEMYTFSYDRVVYFYRPEEIWEG